MGISSTANMLLESLEDVVSSFKAFMGSDFLNVKKRKRFIGMSRYIQASKILSRIMS